MSIVGIVLVVALVCGAALALYAVLAPRRRDAAARVEPERTPLLATTDWTSEAGDEFAGLSESGRCDLIFAVAALDDERSRRLLEHALSDPAEAVALAAAHALESSGRGEVVASFLTAHAGERADRIAATLSLLRPASDSEL